MWYINWGQVNQTHADLNPGITIEHAPVQIVNDCDVYDAIEDETGETTDVDDGGGAT